MTSEWTALESSREREFGMLNEWEFVSTYVVDYTEIQYCWKIAV
jgi:hypothetical protein